MPAAGCPAVRGNVIRQNIVWGNVAYVVLGKPSLGEMSFGEMLLGKRTPYLLYVYSLTTFNAGSFKVRIYDLLKTSKQEEEAEKSDSMMQVTFCLVGRN
jgi:hypothetical protein